MIDFKHSSVLPFETLQLLDIQKGQVVVDTTAGGGGHLMMMADAALPGGKVIGIDQDPRALKDDAAGRVKLKYPDDVTLVHAPFSQVQRVLKAEGITQVDRLLCDLGVSSPQLDDAERGFSFMRDGPLDMRMNTTSGLSALELIQSLSEKDLADLIYAYGEERLSRRIARVIKASGPLPNSTLALAELIAKAVGRRERIHPATRTFQALRIAVNDELGELTTLLNALPELLKPGGRAVLISFHSLEDRLIKHAFRKAVALSKQGAYRILTKKPVIASDDEIAANPRARSAKVRALEKLEEEVLEGKLCDFANSSVYKR